MVLGNSVNVLIKNSIIDGVNSSVKYVVNESITSGLCWVCFDIRVTVWISINWNLWN